MKNKISTFLTVTFLLAVLAGAAIGCKHTAHGAGEDMEQMGQKIQDKTQ